MDEIQQTQKAGKDSNLVQAKSIMVNNNTFVGITEQRARDIFNSEMSQKIGALAVEAQDIATRRMLELFSDLMTRVKKCEKDLSSFSDPSFLQHVRIAQESAAISERKEDIETLSELLLARMSGRLKQTTKTGIRKAMEIVPELDDTELMALSVFLFYTQYNIKSIHGINTSQYLSALNKSFSQLLTTDLPQGKKWLHHLAILDVVIINPAEHFVPIEDYYAQRTTGIICAGIAKDSQEHANAIEELKRLGLNDSVLVDNDLMPGFIRLPIVDLHDLSVLPVRVQIQNIPNYLSVSPNEHLQGVLKKIIGFYDKDQNKLRLAKQKFVEKMVEYKSLMQMKNWLASVGYSFELTSVGEALAYVNARRCIPELPIFELE